MKALELAETTGPEGLALVDKPDPEPSHFMSPGEGVVIDVKAAAVSFPDVLQTRGLYQFKPETPFVPGAEVAGVVIEASEGSNVSAGDRVAAMTMLGGLAEKVAAPAQMTYKLHDELDFAEGAALILNYHTVLFSLKLRGRLKEGEQVLVHGAAGGVGTAALQVAKALGASRAIAVVSSDEKEEVARRAGADEVVRSDAEWKDQVKEISGGGVDVVLDPVGGDRFTDSLRSLREDGRLIVVGFTRRLDPGGEGEPPAAEKHLGGRRRLGRVRDEQAGALRRDPGRARRHDRLRRGEADRGRPLPAGRGRRGDEPDRLARGAREGCA